MDDAARRGEDVSGLEISTEPVKQTVTVPEAKDPRQRKWLCKTVFVGRTKMDLQFAHLIHSLADWLCYKSDGRAQWKYVYLYGWSFTWN